MSWGGGGGGFGGGQTSSQANTAAGLPFAGIPPELADRVEELQADEPDHEIPPVEFEQARYDRQPLTLRRLVAPVVGALVLALLLVIVETVSMRIGPTLTQLAIDRGMGLENLGTSLPIDGDKGFIVVMALAYVGSVVLSMVAGAARVAWSGRVGERLLYVLRVRVFTHLQRLPLAFYTREKAGVLLSRMTSDIDNLQALFHEGIVQLVVQALTVFVLGMQLFLFDAYLALVSLVVVMPVMIVLTRWFQLASDRGYLTVRDRLADVLGDLSESLSGIRLLTAHNRQRHNLIRHTNVVGEYKDANDYTAKVNGIYGPGAENLGTFAVVIVLLIGGNRVLDGQMQVGELTGFILALNQFFAPIQQLAGLYNTYQQGQAGVRKLRELLLIEPEVSEKPDAVDLPLIEGHIVVDGVTFGYDPAEPVLHDVSLDLRPGETVALVGATGAGKSTVAKLVTRFYDPTDGRITIDGHDLRDITISSLRRQIGVVPQEPFLFNGSIRDNIRFARPDATDEEVRGAAERVGLRPMLDKLPLGLDTLVNERGVSLSSGERQLLALARAFLARPRVLVLDEATSNLDLASETEVERALDVVLEGRTAIIIAHRMATAMRADTIAVIDAGELIELGSHEELVARDGLYAAMFDTWQQESSTRDRPVPPTGISGDDRDH